MPLAMAISKEPVMWETPIASDGNNRQFYRNSRGEPNLSGMVKLWPTPSTQELEHPDAVLTESGRRATKSGESSHSLGLADTVRLFPTPAARDSKGANSMEHLLRDGRNHTDQLANAVKLFPTPKAQNSRGHGEKHGDGGESLDVAVGGQLNPDWVEWLMGFPFGWTDPEKEVDKSTMSETGHWLPEPDIPRVAAGVKDRVNRLKCLGNAVVPQQFYPVFRAIAEIEKEMEK